MKRHLKKLDTWTWYRGHIRRQLLNFGSVWRGAMLAFIWSQLAVSTLLQLQLNKARTQMQKTHGGQDWRTKKTETYHGETLEMTRVGNTGWHHRRNTDELGLNWQRHEEEQRLNTDTLTRRSGAGGARESNRRGKVTQKHRKEGRPQRGRNWKAKCNTHKCTMSKYNRKYKNKNRDRDTHSAFQVA